MDSKLKQEIIKVLNAEGLDKAEEIALTAARTAIKLITILAPKINFTAGLVINTLISQYEKDLFKMIDEIDGVDSPDY
jgi:hypothetical protein